MNVSTMFKIAIAITVLAIVVCVVALMNVDRSKINADAQDSPLQIVMPETYYLGIGRNYQVLLIDSCEYIENNAINVPLIHKANCNNPYHKK